MLAAQRSQLGQFPPLHRGLDAPQKIAAHGNLVPGDQCRDLSRKGPRHRVTVQSWTIISAEPDQSRSGSYLFDVVHLHFAEEKTS